MKKRVLILFALLISVTVNAQNESLVPRAMQIRVAAVLQHEKEVFDRNLLVSKFMEANGLKNLEEARSIINNLEENSPYIDEFIYRMYEYYDRIMSYYDLLQEPAPDDLYRFLKRHFDVWGDEVTVIVNNCRKRQKNEELQAMGDAISAIRQRLDDNEVFFLADFDSRYYYGQKPDIYLPFPTPSFATIPDSRKGAHQGRYSFRMVLTKDGQLVVPEIAEQDYVSTRVTLYQNALIQDNRDHPENYRAGYILDREVDSYYPFTIEESFEYIVTASVSMTKNKRTKLWECTNDISVSGGTFPPDENSILKKVEDVVNSDSLLKGKTGARVVSFKLYKQRIVVNENFVVLKQYRGEMTGFNGSPVF